jgi:homocitrate synthase
MCATCNEAVANGSTNGSSTNETNGTNGSSHDGFTSIKSSHNPVPHHKSSPYAPVGDFLSNVSRFKIIGTSPVTLPSAIGDAHRRNLRFVFQLKSSANNDTESTLREGEQFANAYFDLEAKIKIARALDEFGVDCMSSSAVLCLLRPQLTAIPDIELTSPAASEQSRRDCEAICKLGVSFGGVTTIFSHF